MGNFYFFNQNLKSLLLIPTLALPLFSLVDGTKQVMPDNNDGVALYFTDNGQYGSDKDNATPSQRIKFIINGTAGERLFFCYYLS